MWGSFMDRAKGFAANLEEQLNESVGLESNVHSNGAAITSSSSTKSALGSTMPYSATNAAESGNNNNNNNDNDDDDAWNEDFGFEDKEEQEEEVEVQEEAKGEDEPKADVTDDTITTKESQNDDDDDAIVKETEQPQLEAMESGEIPKEDTFNETLTTVPKEDDVHTNTLVPVQPPEPDPSGPSADADVEPVTSGDGWDGALNDIALDDDAEEEIVNDIKQSESKDSVDNQITSPEPDEKSPQLPQQQPQQQSEAAAPAAESPKEQSPSPAMMPEGAYPTTPEKTVTPLHEKPKGPAALSTTATNLFSSFAHRAEALAHQAVHIGNEQKKSSPDHVKTNGDTTSRVSTGFSSLLSSQTASSLLRINMSHTTKDNHPPQDSHTLNSDNREVKDNEQNTGWEGEDEVDMEGDSEETTKEPTNQADKKSHATEPTNGQEQLQAEQSSLVDDSMNVRPTSTASPQEDELQGTNSKPYESESTPPPKNTSDPAQAVPINIEDDPRYQQLLNQLRLREEQLANKSMQMTELQSIMETQEQELRQKITDTKEEAKKRIMRAKERCEAAEAKLKAQQSNLASDSAAQEQIIKELREEGEKLAHKQSAMEQAVRAAKGHSRELAEQLESERQAKNAGLEKIAKLESELKSTKELLAMARKGESQAGKLESDFLAAKSDAEMKAATILSLQQQIKELTAEGKEMQQQLERSRKEAAQEAKQEKKNLQREHKEMISDLETKLRTTEREAGVREDALRHEVAELRKRWQDAIRRADALSMDAQSSTAPLLRQLESMERQNRVRAANWAELETRLRSELEEAVIQNETLSKERSEFKTKYTRLERLRNEHEQELVQSKRLIEEQTTKIDKLEKTLEEMELKAQKQQEDYSRVERLANEGVMRVRSEMTQTVVDSEERYRHQIETLQGELRVEQEKRRQLEKQVEELLDNVGVIVAPDAPQPIRRDVKPKKLRQAQGQAEILAGALGLDSDSDSDDEGSVGHPMDRGDGVTSSTPRGSGGMTSFAALEELSSKLKVAKVELEALRKNLRESEMTRDSLVDELAEARSAKEKLPLFEAKVKELMEENREQELEIKGLRDDVAEVRELYRTQLNVLLEEKASFVANGANGEPPKNIESEPTETSAATPDSS